MSDNASEFRSTTFQAAIAILGARHTFIRAGRPRRTAVSSGSNRPCWTSAGSRLCSLPNPQADRPQARLECYLRCYNTERGPHWQVDEKNERQACPRKGQAVAQEARCV